MCSEAASTSTGRRGVAPRGRNPRAGSLPAAPRAEHRDHCYPAEIQRLKLLEGVDLDDVRPHHADRLVVGKPVRSQITTLLPYHLSKAGAASSPGHSRRRGSCRDCNRRRAAAGDDAPFGAGQPAIRTLAPAISSSRLTNCRALPPSRPNLGQHDAAAVDGAGRTAIDERPDAERGVRICCRSHHGRARSVSSPGRG